MNRVIFGFYVVLHLFNMGLVVRKPVFWVSDQVMLEKSCSASENSKNSGVSIVARIDITLSISEQQRRWSHCADAPAGPSH